MELLPQDRLARPREAAHFSVTPEKEARKAETCCLQKCVFFCCCCCKKQQKNAQVLMWVQSAPEGPRRERFAAASTTTIRFGVVLYGISLAAYLLSFGLVGFGGS